jgi:outer membrane receptor protein involved in Fe transport
MIVSLMLTISQAVADEGNTQTGKLSGRIVDKGNGETLIGVPVMIEGTTIGAVTDLDGNFMLPGIPAGSHSVSIRYVGYQSKVIREVTVRPGEVTNLEVAMESGSQELNEVTIVAELKRENIGALMVLQQKSATVQDGISAESIKRTPDRSTSEVVRRVSGASVQEGKFVIIRGLNDRYNSAMLNGVPLASTEPDRKAFSFDLFPANLLDNLIVVKTATPDLPGEFAGGLLQVNTRDIPDQRFMSFSAGTSVNSISTFKNYEKYEGGKKDWLGIDDGTRSLPEGFMDSESLKSASTAEKINQSKILPNDWKTEEAVSQPMAQNYQFSFGNSKELGKDRFGFIGALTYSNSQRTSETERADFDFDGQQNFEYSDRQYRDNIFWGALFNASYKIGDRSKISFRNLYSVNSNDQVIHRHGFDLENAQEIDAKALWFASNSFLNSVLNGEHALNEKGLRVNWNLGYSRIQQSTPDLRRSLYYRDANTGAEDTNYYAYVPFGTASPNYSGKFYSTLEEGNRFGETSVTIPLGKSGSNHSIKTGIFEQQKERTFDARVLGYVVTNASRFNWSYLQLPVENLFTPEHMGTDGFRIDEITNPSDHYTASSFLHAGYILSDNRIAEKSRIVWGLRVENFIQELRSYGYSNEKIDVNTNVTDVLPSLNYTYAAGEHTNLRFAASRTVARPEFRELAPFAFYDFVTATSVAGNSNIRRSQITNIDLRWETFPAAGEMLSASVFFKDFNDPIEPVVESSGAGSRRISFQNAERGTVYGIETEWRKKLDFLDRWITWNQLENFSVYGNLSLMKSRVDVSNDARSLGERPMQGQSPYVLNAGFQYLNPKSGVGCNIVFNRIGDRIFQVGNQGYLSILEAPRSIFDVQVSKRIFDKGEVKLGVNDLLNRPAVFYQDVNGNGKYDAGNDSRISNTLTGTTISLSVSYKF